MNINKLVKPSGGNRVLRGVSALIGFSATVLLTVTAPASADVNLVTNGDFSDVGGATSSFVFNGANLPGWSGGGEFDCVVFLGTATTDACGNGATLWSGSGTTVVGDPAATTDSAPPDGGNYLAMDGDFRFNGVISQTLMGLTPDTDYNVTFWQSAAQFQFFHGGLTLSCGSDNTSDQWQVSFGTDGTQLSPLMCNADAGFYGWEQETLTFFNASATSEVLGFLAEGTPLGLPPVALLDSVSVTAITPEPGAWALLGTVLASVVIARRRRTKRC